MKKLLYSSVVLLLFSTSVLLFQISCQKDAEANNENTTVTQNKFIYAVYNSTGWQYWTSNIDGTNDQPITISLPSGQRLYGSCKLTPDSKKIIFCASGGSGTVPKHYIYSSNIDGSNVTFLKEISTQQLEINATY